MSQVAFENTAPPQDMQHQPAPSGRRWRQHISHLVFAAVGIGGGVAVALGGIDALYAAIGRPAPVVSAGFRTGLAASWLVLWLGCEWMISSARRANTRRMSPFVSALIAVGVAAMVGGLALAFAK